MNGTLSQITQVPPQRPYRVHDQLRRDSCQCPIEERPLWLQVNLPGSAWGLSSGELVQMPVLEQIEQAVKYRTGRGHADEGR